MEPASGRFRNKKSGRFTKKDDRKLAQGMKNYWKQKRTQETLQNVQIEHCYGSDDIPFEEEIEIEPDGKGSANTIKSSKCTINTSKLVGIGEHREIVELDVLIKGLEHCTGCLQELSLSGAIGIKPYGLSGILYVMCKCGFPNSVHLGKRHCVPGTRAMAYDVNTKCATGKATFQIIVDHN